MVLTLYHDDKEPYRLLNCINVSVDNQRTVTARTKVGHSLINWSYRIDKDYQRLTVQVD